MEELYFGDPNKKGKFHIFNKEKRSLCGKWSMPFTKFDKEDIVKGTETCGSSDCKMCFKKLNDAEKETSTPTQTKKAPAHKSQEEKDIHEDGKWGDL